MFNVAIIKLKDIIKCFLLLFFIILIIYLIKLFFSFRINIKYSNINIQESISSIFNKYMFYPINTQIIGINNIDNGALIDENNENADKEFFEGILETELAILNIDLSDSENEIEYVETPIVEENLIQDTQDDINVNVSTEVVTENPLADKYTKIYNGVKIKNETDFNLTDDMLDTSTLNINNSNILIFHTHTCESYTSSEKYSYDPTGNFRTTNLSFTVARVGDELENYLKNFGYNIIHDKTYHDYPKYNGSYTKSFSTVSNILKDNPSDIIIDLHRDAIGSYSTYAPCVKIGEDYCAQIMFVMGTNGGGLEHPNWQSNLKFALKIQEEAEKIYPGLFKPLILRNSRYNQNLGKAACIIEVGATGNTLEQCLNSMKYLSKIISLALPLE